MPFTSPVERLKAPHTSGEGEMLAGYLDFGRATILHKMNGLEDADLRRPIGPGGLTLLGLVKHLTLAEQWWFAIHWARTGEPVLFEDPKDPDLDLHVKDDESTDAIVAGFLRECRRSREFVAANPKLDDVVAHKSRREVSLRWIMLHMIEEYARHAGHADIIRELIDGATGF
jgi:uncharacterized damage-inducible protein DinB